MSTLNKQTLNRQQLRYTLRNGSDGKIAVSFYGESEVIAEYVPNAIKQRYSFEGDLDEIPPDGIEAKDKIPLAPLTIKL